MICPNCKKEIKNTAKFCPFCGFSAVSHFSDNRNETLNVDSPVQKARRKSGRKLNLLTKVIIFISVTLVIIAGIFFAVKKIRTPDADLIRRNLEESLQDVYGDTISDFSYKITSGFTQDKLYQADIEISATGKYAYFDIESTVYYEKHDQEWVTTGTLLNKVSYEIYRYPDSSTLLELIMSQKDMDDFTIIGTVESGDTVTLNYQETIEESFYTCKRDYYEVFTFDPKEDEWYWESSDGYVEDSDSQIDDISGNYTVEEKLAAGGFADAGIFKISDVTDESFTVSGNNLNEPITFTFTIRESGYGCYIHLEDDNSTYYLFSEDDNNTDNETTFAISKGKDYDGEADSRSTYYKLTFLTSPRDAIDSGSTFNGDCIIDELGWVDNIVATGENLEDFYNATGVQPYIYFKEYDASLTTDSEKEEYAFQWYEDNIDNEDTFLYIYFAEEDAENDVGYMVYVNGLNVDSVMDEEAVEIFWDYVDEYWYSELSTDDVLIKIFDSTADAIM